MIFDKIHTSKSEFELIGKIIDRYMTFHYSLGVPKELQRPRMNIFMDIEAVHASNPLNLQGLLEASDGDFAHDINGIQINLNRQIGKLENCFAPRYSV